MFRKRLTYSALILAFILALLQFTPPDFIYRHFVAKSHATDITNLQGNTSKIADEDVYWGTGQTTDTFSSPTYTGGNVTLTKVPALSPTIASTIKSEWYASNNTAIVDHGNVLTVGSIAWTISTMVASGATHLVIPDGDYPVTSASIVVPEGCLKIIGLGGARVYTSSASIAVFDVQGADNLTIEGITIESTATFANYVANGSGSTSSNLIKNTVAADNVTLRNCTLVGGYTGIRPAYGSTNWKVINCIIKDQKFCGIMAEMSNLEIRSTKFQGCGTDSSDTTFHGAGQGLASHGLYFNAANEHSIYGLRVIDCDFDDITGSGLAVSSGTANTAISDVTIRGNRFRRCSYFTQFASSTRLRHQLELSILDASSYLLGANVSENQFIEAPATPVGASEDDYYRKACIYLRGDLRDVVISNNVSPVGSGFLQAVMSEPSGAIGPARTAILGNTFNLTRTGLPASVYTSYGSAIAASAGMEHWRIENNLISGAQFAFRGVLDYALISGNIFKDCGVNNTGAFAYLYFTGGDYNTIGANYFFRGTNNSKRGIWFVLGSDNNKVLPTNVFDEVGWASYDRVYNEGAGNDVGYRMLYGVTENWDPANLTTGSSATTTITVTGARLGDLVIVGFGRDLEGCEFRGYISADDTVTVYLTNNTGGDKNFSGTNIEARVFKPFTDAP